MRKGSISGKYGDSSKGKKSFILYEMILITLLLVAGVTMYLSYFATTEETLRTDKNITHTQWSVEIYSWR